MLPLRYIARVWPDHDELELAEARAAAMGGMGDFASPW